jgi:hypothetical protein
MYPKELHEVLLAPTFHISTARGGHARVGRQVDDRPCRLRCASAYAAISIRSGSVSETYVGS